MSTGISSRHAVTAYAADEAFRHAVAELHKAESGRGWRYVGAYVILPPIRRKESAPAKYGMIKILYPTLPEGKLKVWLWDTVRSRIKMGELGGRVEDKLGAALEGLVFDEFKLSADWKYQLEGMGYIVIQVI